MGRNDKRKERHRLKRQERKIALRRMQSGSPYRRLRTAGGDVACYINEDWHEQGIGSLLVFRHMPDGSHVLGAFLIDFWCIGLKDAWGRLNLTNLEVDDALRQQRSSGMSIVRIEPAVARRLVAGAVRFSRQNGFRLPRRFERWTAVLGDLGNFETADLSDFGTADGKLRYIGRLEDLRDRLIGCSVEEFMQREDVEYILGGPMIDSYASELGLCDEEAGEYPGPGDAAEVDEDEADLEEKQEADETVERLAETMRNRQLDAIRKWCFANGLRPHPLLGELLDLTAEAILQIRGDDETDPDADGLADAGCENLDQLLSLESPAKREAMREALAQISGFMEQFHSPEQFAKALGLDKIADDLGIEDEDENR